MKTVIESRLQATEEQNGRACLPRIVRLCRNFKFTTNETRIAVLALVLQSGYDREGHYSSYGPDVLSACKFLEIPLQEMLDFLDEERLHMQQGFFPEIQSNYILTCSISYDSDFCKALMGSQLKANEFLKLEQTYLADVIAEEPGNEHYRDENLGLKLPTPKLATAPTTITGEATAGEQAPEGEGEMGAQAEPPADSEPHPMFIPPPTDGEVE